MDVLVGEPGQSCDTEQELVDDRESKRGLTADRKESSASFGEPGLLVGLEFALLDPEELENDDSDSELQSSGASGRRRRHCSS